MKKKILSIIITVALLIALVPLASLSAEPDLVEVDVSDYWEFFDAIDDDDVDVINVIGSISFTWQTVSIPSGKTVVIKPMSNSSKSLELIYADIIVDSGAKLINEGKLIGFTSSIYVDGEFENHGVMDQITLGVFSGGQFVNASSGHIENRVVALMSGGVFANNGAFFGKVLTVSGAPAPTISGVPASQIENVDEPVEYTDINYKEIDFSSSISETISLSGDDSVITSPPYSDRLNFATGYSFNVEEGQTIVIQSQSDFPPVFYLLNENMNVYDVFIHQGTVFDVYTSGQYYLLVSGLALHYGGTFTITIYESETSEPEILDFRGMSTESGEGWSWNSETKELSLSGIQLLGSIILPEDATVRLVAGTDNFILGRGSYSGGIGPVVVMDAVDALVAIDDVNYPPFGIHGVGNLHISGEGNLTINALEMGIFSEGSLRIDTSGSVSVSALDVGILSFGNLSIVNAANIQAAAIFTGIYSESDILIDSSKVLSYGIMYGIVTSDPNSYRLIEVNGGGPTMMIGDISYTGGDITIKNSDVIAYCDSSNGNAAIYAGDYITDPDADGHAQLFILNSVINYPQNARIVDTAILSPYYGEVRCQTLTTLPSIDLVTSWDQAVKYVEISRATITISFDANGGTGDALNPIVLGVGGTLIVPEPTFLRSGYVFDSWNTMPDGSGQTYMPGDVASVDSSFVLYAQWVRLFTVEFVDWSGSVLSTQQVRQGNAADAPSVPARAGYNFVGWDTDFSSVQSDLTVNAVYSAESTTPEDTTPEDTTATPDGTQTGSVPQTGESTSSIVMPIIFIVLAFSMMSVVVFVRRRKVT